MSRLLKSLLIIAGIIVVSGCIVTPAPYYTARYGNTITYQQPAYQQPAYQQPAYQQPAYQQPVHQPPVQEYIPYPIYESSYMFDSGVGLYFFWCGDHRCYMDSGWHFRVHGIPNGVWHGIRR